MDLFRENLMADKLPRRAHPYSKLQKDKGKDKLPFEEPREEKDHGEGETDKLPEAPKEQPRKEKAHKQDKLPEVPKEKPRKEKAHKQGKLPEVPKEKPRKEKAHKQDMVPHAYNQNDSKQDIEGKHKYEDKQRKGKHERVLMCFFLAFVLGLLILAFFAMVFYISMHPRLPSISIRDANITAFRPYNQYGASGLDVNIQFTMVANNTHDLTYRFPPGNLNLSYWFNESVGYDLCPVVTDGFIVGKKSIREFNASCGQAYQGLPDELVHALINDVIAPPVQRVYLRGRLKAKYKTSWFLNNLRKQVGVCQNLTIYTSSEVPSSEVVKKRCGSRLGCVVERQAAKFDHALACNYY